MKKFAEIPWNGNPGYYSPPPHGCRMFSNPMPIRVNVFQNCKSLWIIYQIRYHRTAMHPDGPWLNVFQNCHSLLIIYHIFHRKCSTPLMITDYMSSEIAFKNTLIIAETQGILMNTALMFSKTFTLNPLQHSSWKNIKARTYLHWQI